MSFLTNESKLHAEHIGFFRNSFKKKISGKYISRQSNGLASESRVCCGPVFLTKSGIVVIVIFEKVAMFSM